MIMGIFAAVQNMFSKAAGVSHCQFVTDMIRYLLAKLESKLEDALSGPSGRDISDT